MDDGNQIMLLFHIAEMYAKLGALSWINKINAMCQMFQNQTFLSHYSLELELFM